MQCKNIGYFIMTIKNMFTYVYHDIKCLMPTRAIRDKFPEALTQYVQ